MRLMISEVLQLVGKKKSRAERIEVLRANWSPVLGQILQYCYDPKYEFVLPEGDPPYEPNDAPEVYGALFHEARRMYIFVKGGNDAVPQAKREVLFVNFLESIHPEDAKLILMVKNKKITYHGITVPLIMEAFPGLLPESARPKE